MQCIAHSTKQLSAHCTQHTVAVSHSVSSPLSSAGVTWCSAVCVLHTPYVAEVTPSDEVTFRAERSDHVSCSFRTEVLNNVLVLLGLGGETGGCYRQVADTVVS